MPGPVLESYLFAGIDHPLRMHRGASTTVYFELDLAGNVRRLRGPSGTDLGGYRYTAFGKTVTDDALVDQPLRWKGRWYSAVAGGVYDVRARQWSPELGSFLSVDEFEFHDAKGTLWSWPNQNPLRFSDPSGRLTANAWVGMFNQSEISGFYDVSGELALIASRSFDAGSYAQAAVAFNTSTQVFGAAIVSDLFLRKRRPTGVDAAMMACPIEIPGGIGAGAAERAVTAADPGMPNAALSQLRGSVVNAGSTRILSVEMIEGRIAPSELKGALSSMVDAARADGVQTLQIQATFGNDRLQPLVAREATRLGGTLSTTGSTDTITFTLGAR